MPDRNDTTLGDLLIGFFRYYAHEFKLVWTQFSFKNREMSSFEAAHICFYCSFDENAISVRLGKSVPRAEVVQQRSPFNWLSQWRCICIEEPFQLSNAAHSVYDERIFEQIKASFAAAYDDLQRGTRPRRTT